MTNYPIIRQSSLDQAKRTGPWGIGPRIRKSGDLPSASAHEAIVYKSGGAYFVDDGRSRLSDDHIVSATNISVVDMREEAPVTVSAQIPSAGAAEFTIRATFLCTVRRPEDVVDAGLIDIAEPLRQYLVRHQPLFHVGEEFELDQINIVRRNVTAEVKAYVSVRPPWFRGVEVALGSVQVMTPSEVIEFEGQRRERRWAGVLASENQKQDHVLAQERQEQDQVAKLTQQGYSHDLAKHAELNSRELAEMQRELYEQQELLRRRHEHFMAEMRQEFDHMREERQAGHDQMIRSARFEHAIGEAEKLRTAIGAAKSEMPTLLSTTAGEHTLSETAEMLDRDRRRERDTVAADALRQETWAREDLHDWLQTEREAKQAKWQAERDEAAFAHKLKVAQLQAQVQVLNTGIARGLADPMSIDKVLRTLDGAAKELGATPSVDQEIAPSAFGAGDATHMDDDVHDAEIVEDADTRPAEKATPADHESPVVSAESGLPDGAAYSDGPEVREEDLGY